MKPRSEEILSEVRGPRILDIGCAGGLQDDVPPMDSPSWIHQHLLDSYPDTWGIELSHERVEYLRSHGVPNVLVADAEDFQLDMNFDTIVAGELIEHLSNPGRFLLSAAKHLRPDGRIILTTPYAMGLPNVLYAWVKFPKTCSNPEHFVWFCPTTLSKLSRNSGLRVVEWRLIEDFPEPGRRGSLNWLGLKVYRLIRWILPSRLRANGMLYVLEMH